MIEFVQTNEGMRILVVEDEPRLQRNLAKALREEGYAVDTADAGDDGLYKAESYEYDAAGRKKKTFYVDLAAQRPDTQYSWGVEGTDSSY